MVSAAAHWTSLGRAAMRGRMQGVFIVVVAGGARPGDHGLGRWPGAGVGVAMVSGAIVTVIAMAVVAVAVPASGSNPSLPRCRRLRQARRDRRGRRRARRRRRGPRPGSAAGVAADPGWCGTLPVGLGAGEGPGSKCSRSFVIPEGRRDQRLGRGGPRHALLLRQHLSSVSQPRPAGAQTLGALGLRSGACLWARTGSASPRRSRRRRGGRPGVAERGSRSSPAGPTNGSP